MDPAPNEELAGLIAEAGVTHRGLAKEIRDLAVAQDLDVRCTHVDIGRWLAGRTPRGAKPDLIAQVLGKHLGRPLTHADIGLTTRPGPPLDLGLRFEPSPAAVLRTGRALWKEDLSRAGFIRRGAVTAAMLTVPMARWLLASPADSPERTGRALHVGPSDVEAILATVRMFEDLDHRFGGGHARTAAVQYLHSAVAPMLNGSYTARVGRDLFAAAAQSTYKAGAMAYDVGRHGLARRYFVQALNLAHGSGDRALGGKVLALMSHQANFLGEYLEAVDLARAAKLGARGHATPTVHAMYCAMEARALASQGNHRECVKAMREAEIEFDRRNPSDDPEWIAYFDEAELHDEFAHCFRGLCETQEADRHATMSLRASGDAYPRSRTFCRLTLAGAYIDVRRPRDRDIERACAIAGEAVATAGRLKSGRVRAYLKDLDRRLAEFGTAKPVRELRRQMAGAHEATN
ncbi:MAG TPA: hypothetical protein VGL93_17160 [Streptosporangiaceae bacterium]|jgi:hypothetical protein